MGHNTDSHICNIVGAEAVVDAEVVLEHGDDHGGGGGALPSYYFWIWLNFLGGVGCGRGGGGDSDGSVGVPWAEEVGLVAEIVFLFLLSLGVFWHFQRKTTTK